MHYYTVCIQLSVINCVFYVVFSLHFLGAHFGFTLPFKDNIVMVATHPAVCLT